MSSGQRVNSSIQELVDSKELNCADTATVKSYEEIEGDNPTSLEATKVALTQLIIFLSTTRK